MISDRELDKLLQSFMKLWFWDFNETESCFILIVPNHQIKNILDKFKQLKKGVIS